MKNCRLIAHLLALVVVLGATYGAAAQQAVQQPQRPIELTDILKWKRIASPSVSNDGGHFAWKVVPVEGDGEVVLRRLSDGKEWKFPIGQSPAGGGFGRGGGDLEFSDDGKWLAFTVYPGFKEAKQARKTRRTLYNKVALINLESAKKVEFEKIRRFSFSGENAAWLALHKYGAAPAGPATPPPTTPPSGSAPAPDRASGTDLILYELATGNQLNIGNVSEFAFDKKGSWLAWIIDAQDKTGNGVQARNMATGAVVPLESDNAVYKRLNWTEKGEGLAAVKGVDDKAWEDKLYSLVAFNFTSGTPQKTVYDPRGDKDFPAGLTISPNRSPDWTEDMSAVFFGIHEVKKKKAPANEKAKEGEAKAGPPAPPAAQNGQAAARKPEDEPEAANLVLWHWQDRRLQAQQQVEESRDKNYSYLSIYHVADKKFVRLADDSVRNVTLTPRHKYALGYDNSGYELMGNLDGQRYQDIYAVDLGTGARKQILKKHRWSYNASPDGTQFLYYDDGHYHAYDLTTGRSQNLTAGVPAVFWNQEDDHNVVKPPRFPMGWSSDGKSVLLTDGWDIWNIPVRGGKAVNLTGNGKKDGIRYRQRFQLDPDEKGVDLSAALYVNAYGEWTKKSGIARLDAGKPGARMLMWDDAAYFTLIKAKRAEKYLYTRETDQNYPDYYLAADGSLGQGQRLTTANPQQKEFLWSAGARLINYTSAKGDKLQGALYLPANYQPGKSYPTIVYIYEKLSQGMNSYAFPTANGFNKSVYTSNGYAVFMPDIVYKVNDPGMSAVWCVLPALKAAIETGVVDKDRVAIHGHSWGGYQTSFLVTQTDAFRAAIAGAPLTDMISMYNQIYWNTGSGNMSIFESSQGRFTSSPVDNVEAYIRNSPVYHARNVKTPLIILHNDKDGAVDFSQGIEYFNQLRRLQKPVVMFQYKGENHGLRVPANQKDYTVRMKEFFDHQLMGKPAPKWWIEGVPHLKLKEHLEERAKEIENPITPLECCARGHSF